MLKITFVIETDKIEVLGGELHRDPEVLAKRRGFIIDNLAAVHNLTIGNNFVMHAPIIENVK